MEANKRDYIGEKWPPLLMELMRPFLHHFANTVLRREISDQMVALRDQMVALSDQMAVLRQEIAELKRSILRERSILSKRFESVPKQIEEPTERARVRVRSFEHYLRRLESMFPDIFKIWHGLLETNCDAYHEAPDYHCSTEGHDVAQYFGFFIAPHLSGKVLDIGCGPQAIPSYLKDYPTELISAIDPIPPSDPHPFEFVRGLVEFLPWSDDTFDVVIAATSLDHVLSLDRAFSEIVKVLKPKGLFLAWVGFIEGSEPYDTSKPDLSPVDEYHLFHFAEGWFEDLATRWFVVKEKFNFDNLSYFYCLVPKN
jgi:SAM-dependent methyltransferase